MAISRRRFSAGLSAILTLPGLIGRAAAQGATIKIGMCAPVTGPAAESGRYAQIGAKLAVDTVNKAGGVLGKQVELIAEYGVKVLGKKKWAIVHSTDAFGTAGGKALAAALAKIDGVTIALDQGY